MKSGRRRAWLAFTIAGAFVLAACGGTDSTTEEVEESADTVAVTDTTVAAETAPPRAKFLAPPTSTRLMIIQLIMNAVYQVSAFLYS